MKLASIAEVQPILSKETVLPLSAMLAKKQRTAPNQKDCPIFIKPYTME